MEPSLDAACVTNEDYFLVIGVYLSDSVRTFGHVSPRKHYRFDRINSDASLRCGDERVFLGQRRQRLATVAGWPGVQATFQFASAAGTGE